MFKNGGTYWTKKELTQLRKADKKRYSMAKRVMERKQYDFKYDVLEPLETEIEMLGKMSIKD